MKNKPQYRQEWILDLLKSEPKISHGEMFGKYSVKFGCSGKTFDKDWKKAKSEIETYQIKVQKEKEAVSIAVEKEAIKKGLKTKIDRLLLLQEQIMQIEGELDKGECEDFKMIGGKAVKIIRPLLPLEKSAMRRNIKELQAEISKIEGDYATAKQEVEIKESKIDYSKIDTETLKAFISARK